MKDQYIIKTPKAQHTPSNMNSKKPTLRPIITKLCKATDKRSWKLWEVNHHVQGIPNKIISRFLFRNRGQNSELTQSDKKKKKSKLSTKNPPYSKTVLQNGRDIKTFPEIKAKGVCHYYTWPKKEKKKKKARRKQT